MVTHELTIPGRYKRFDNEHLPPVEDALRNAISWDVSSINIYLCSRVTRLANTGSDEWLLFSYREIAPFHGNSGTSPKFDVTFTNDLNTEHRLLMLNISCWSLCDYKYLAASLALTNTKTSEPTTKFWTPHHIFLLLHSTPVLKILLTVHEQEFSKWNYKRKYSVSCWTWNPLTESTSIII